MAHTSEANERTPAWWGAGVLFVIRGHQHAACPSIDQGGGKRRAGASLLLFSANGAKDRSVANVRCSVVFVQPLGHFATDRQIRQMVGRPRCAPQFDRSPPYPLAIWLRCYRRGRGGGHLAIEPVEKILFDNRK